MPVGSVSTLLNMDATTNGRQVTISQSVRVLEKIPNASRVWVLRIFRDTAAEPGQQSKKRQQVPVLERCYTNQLFHVPADAVEMRPTFREAVELEPGAYLIRVSLIRMRRTLIRPVDRRGHKKDAGRHWHEGGCYRRRVVNRRSPGSTTRRLHRLPCSSDAEARKCNIVPDAASAKFRFVRGTAAAHALARQSGGLAPSSVSIA